VSARKRFSREDWLDFGLAQLAEGGPEALSIHRFCEAAERTIGSFYHHFTDRPGFTTAMLARWRKLNTEDVIAAVDQFDDPVKQSAQLNAIAIALNQPVELGVRLLAGQSKRAAVAVAEVDQMRIDHLAGLHRAISGLSAELALDMARLEYASFVGGQVIWRENAAKHGPRLAALFEAMARAYVVKE
jgi:AcrR family transcriptional regulator